MMKQDLKNFVSETSIHGFQYVGSSRSKVELLIWISIITAAFVYSGHQVQQMINEWRDFPVITNVEVKPVEEIKFPGIAVFNSENFRPDGFIENVLNRLVFRYETDEEKRLSEKMRTDFKSTIERAANFLIDTFTVQIEGFSIDQIKQTIGSDPTWSREKTRIMEYAMFLPRYLSADQLDLAIKNFTNQLKNRLGNKKVLEPWLSITSELFDPLIGAKNVQKGKVDNQTISNILTTIYSNLKMIEMASKSNFGTLVVSCLSKRWLIKEEALNKFFLGFFERLGDTSGLRIDVLASHLYEKALNQLRGKFNTAKYWSFLDRRYLQASFDLAECAIEFYTNSAVEIFDELRCNTTNEETPPGVQGCCKILDFTRNGNRTLLMKMMKHLFQSPTTTPQVDTLLFVNDYIVYPCQSQNFPQNPLMTGFTFQQLSRSISYSIPENEIPLFEFTFTSKGLGYSFSANDFKILFEKSNEDTNNFLKTMIPFESSIRLFNLSTSRPKDNYMELWFYVGEESKGLYYELFDPKGYHDVSTVANFARVGYKTIVNFTPTRKMAAANLETEVPEVARRSCRFPNENNLMLFKKYTKRGCLYECGLQITVNQCRCIPWDAPPFGDWKHCDYEGLVCAMEVRRMLTLEFCNCAQSCIETSYAYPSLRTPITNEEFNEHDACRKYENLFEYLPKEYLTYQMSLSKQNTVPKVREDFCIQLLKKMVVLQIDMPSYVTEITQYKTEPKITFSGQLCSFGGSLGLFTGMSIMSCFEIFFWLCRFLISFLRSMLIMK